MIVSAYDSNSYLDDNEATQAAFTSDGFYKTGDLAHLVNGEYVIDGRTSADCEYINHIITKLLFQIHSNFGQLYDITASRSQL